VECRCSRNPSKEAPLDFAGRIHHGDSKECVTEFAAANSIIVAGCIDERPTSDCFNAILPQSPEWAINDP